MAQALSAKKRIRQNAKRRARNRRRKDQIKQAVRSFGDALRQHDTDLASERLKEVYKRLDQVVAKGTIHKSTAARQKARLARRLSSVGK